MKYYLLIGFLGLMIFSCQDISEVQFETYQDLSESGYLSKGWIPKILPETSSNIKEVHNLDINRVFGTFNFFSLTKNNSIVIFNQLIKISPDQVIARKDSITSPKIPNWFPSDKEIRNSNFELYLYEDFYLILNMKSEIGYFLK